MNYCKCLKTSKENSLLTVTFRNKFMMHYTYVNKKMINITLMFEQTWCIRGKF